MPVARFEMPDGRIGRFEVPEGTMPEQATVLIQDHLKTSPIQQTSQPVPKETVSGNIIQAAKNIPQSAINVGTSIASAVGHPIDTTKGLINIAAGSLQRALEPESWKKSGNPFLHSPEAEQAFNVTSDFYKNRYGSLEKAKQAFIQDPVGVAMDLSGVTGITGTAAKLAGLSKTANVLNKVSSVTDPVRQVARAAKGIMRPAYTHIAGQTTGAGAEVIKEALKGGDAFTQAMRGKISETDVLDTAKNALQTLKDERGAAYRSKLESLKSNTRTLDIADIKGAANSWLTKYGINATPNGLDFSRSVLRNNPTAANEVKAVYETIQDWGSKTKDLTPSGLDTLKRVISDSFTSQNPSRAMVSDLANKVKTKIIKAVPEYGQMTKDYAKASDMIDDVTRGLSLSDKSATDTALRKLMMAMREDKTFRRGLIEKLSETTGKDVAGAVSGLIMKNPWSNRMGSHIATTAGLGGILYGHPATGMPLLMASSPRLVGEASNLAGQAARKLPATYPLYMGAYQAGRIPGLRDDDSLR